MFVVGDGVVVDGALHKFEDAIFVKTVAASLALVADIVNFGDAFVDEPHESRL